jgi:hypothetical protein
MGPQTSQRIPKAAAFFFDSGPLGHCGVSSSGRGDLYCEPAVTLKSAGLFTFSLKRTNPGGSHQTRLIPAMVYVAASIAGCRYEQYHGDSCEASLRPVKWVGESL